MAMTIKKRTNLESLDIDHPRVDPDLLDQLQPHSVKVTRNLMTDRYKP